MRDDLRRVAGVDGRSVSVVGVGRQSPRRARRHRSGPAGALRPASRCAGVGGATSSVTRVRQPSGSTRAATRGIRTSPMRSSRDGLRSSRRAPRRGASARLTKSTGTYHVAAVARPARRAARSSVRRRTRAAAAATARSSAFRPSPSGRRPAASSRTVRLNSRARSSSANISWPLITRGERPARIARQHGIWKSRRGRLIGRQ